MDTRYSLDSQHYQLDLCNQDRSKMQPSNAHHSPSKTKQIKKKKSSNSQSPKKYGKFHRDLGSAHKQILNQIIRFIPYLITDHKQTREILKQFFVDFDKRFTKITSLRQLFFLIAFQQDSKFIKMLENRNIQPRFGYQRFHQLIQGDNQFNTLEYTNFLGLIDFIFKKLKIHSQYSGQVYRKFKQLLKELKRKLNKSNQCQYKSQNQLMQTLQAILEQNNKLKIFKENLGLSQNPSQDQVNKIIEKLNNKIRYQILMKQQDVKGAKKAKEANDAKYAKDCQQPQAKLSQFFLHLKTEAAKQGLSLYQVLNNNWEKLLSLVLQINLPKYFKQKFNHLKCQFPNNKNQLFNKTLTQEQKNYIKCKFMLQPFQLLNFQQRESQQIQQIVSQQGWSRIFSF